MPFGISAGTASLIGAGVSAAGGVASSLIQSGNAGKAGAQAQRNLQMILPQMQTNYAQGQNQLAPYITAGTAGTGAEADLLGLNGPEAAAAAMQRFQTSPGYQFQMEQGLRGVDAGAAAKEMLRSGATLKAEDVFAQGLANSDFGQYYNRLAGLSSLGDTAVGQSITAGNNLIAQEEGNAQAQNLALTNTANAQNSATGNLFSGLGNTANNLLNNNAFLNMVGGGSSMYGNAAPGTPGISASGNPVMTGFIGNQNIGSPGAYIPPALPYSG
jgi:hypothetical protein